MSAQIIKLADRRKRRPTTSSTLVDLPISVFAAYTEIGLAIYLSMVDAAQHVFKHVEAVIGVDQIRGTRNG
jgi:hypothetical protein